jgi:citrate-Mg2+:H+ or citrate-Ca2+:H+ symporter, CitMHS family
MAQEQLTFWLATFGVIIVGGFMVLIMTKKASPFTALVLTPLVVGIGTGLSGLFGYSWTDTFKYGIAGIIGNADSVLKDTFTAIENGTTPPSSASVIGGVVGTAVLLLFAILYFGLMLSAGLFDPVVDFILNLSKGDPLKVLVGTALLSLAVSVDGDGSTTTLVVCAAMIPVYHRLKMKMMDLAVLVILSNSIMNLLPWGGPTARIIASLKVDSGDLLRRIIPGMILAAIWVIGVAYLRGRSERKRLGIVKMSEADMAEFMAQQHEDDLELARPKMVWFNLVLTLLMLSILIFGGIGFVPKINAALIFPIGLAVALVINYRNLKDQRKIVDEYGSSAVHVIVMVLAAGVFMGVLAGTGMSTAMGTALSSTVHPVLSSHWPLVVAVLSAPGAFLLSNDAFYLGVLPVLNQVGLNNGFSTMDIAVASTAGQAFHLLSPLVGFIYLLLNLTGVDMGKWQIQSAKWAVGTFVLFLIAMFAFGGVQL